MAPVIYYHYFGFSKIGKPYSSPLRFDKNPSFALFELHHKDEQGNYSIPTGMIYWKDFSTGEYGSLFDLLKKKFKIYDDIEVYFKILEEVDFDKAVDFSINNSSAKLQNIIPSKNKDQVYKYYSSNYDIDSRIVDKFNVQEALMLQLFDGSCIVPTQFSMYWTTHLGGTTIYSPYDTKYKWSGIGTKGIEGLEQLPEEGDLLIITKALKEVMFFKHHFDISSISHHESYMIEQSIINDLKKRFTTIVTYFDNDETGIKIGNKYKEEYAIQPHLFRWAKNITDGYEIDKDLTLNTFKQQRFEIH